MKKIFSIIFFLIDTLFLCSCSPEQRFERAFEKLDEKSYTMEGRMILELEMSILDYKQKQTIASDIKIEASPNQVYTLTTVDGQTQQTYTKINGKTVDVYTEVDGEWEHESMNFEDYLVDSETYFLDIDVKDVFVESEGIWVGDTEKITEMMKESLEKIASELAGTGASIDKMSVEKYNIEMKNNKISKIDMVIEMKMSVINMSISMKMTMPMNVSNIGKTKVTVPENIE